MLELYEHHKDPELLKRAQLALGYLPYDVVRVACLELNHHEMYMVYCSSNFYLGTMVNFTKHIIWKIFSDDLTGALFSSRMCECIKKLWIYWEYSFSD